MGIKFIIKKNTEALSCASKEVSLEINAENTKQMFMTHYQNVHQKHYTHTHTHTHTHIYIVDKSTKIVTKFKYLEVMVTNQNYIHNIGGARSTHES
jgi:hypothetical protein